MTSKEFKRRVSYYAQFLEAFDCFQNPLCDSFIWKISVFEVIGRSHVFYRMSPYLSFSDAIFFDFDVDNIVIEKYSKSRYIVDVRYFSSFVSGLSEFQYQVLESDSRFINILNFLKNGKEK